MGLLERIRPQPGWKDADPKVRRQAVRTLSEAALLAEVTRTDPDAEVRDEATEGLLRLAEGEDEMAGLEALAALPDPKQLLQVARAAAREAVSRAALARLADPKALGSVARHGRHGAIRLEALRRLGDPDEVAAVAQRSPHDDAALAALERFAAEPQEEAARIAAIAENARSAVAKRRARILVHEIGIATGHPAGPPPKTDRRKQQRLCEQAESFARSQDCEPLGVRLSEAEDAWIALLPGVDEDLHERFTAACRKGRERLARNLTERAERDRLERERADLVARHLAPRGALCEAVESAEGEEAPRRLEESRWAWDRLEPAEAAEGWVAGQARALARRFEEACTACERRHAARLKEQDDARLQAESAAARRERARRDEEDSARRAANAARLRRLGDRVERLLGGAAGAAGSAGKEPSLNKAEPALRDLRAALDDLPPLPSRREHRELLERLKTLGAALAPKVKELREAERWKRWANATVQEELCARAEALREIADPAEAARQIPELLERWKTAAEVSKDKAQELWLRFKGARDEALARLEAYHVEQAARKQALCEQAESLAASTEWARTAEAIKRLQAEWKTVGPAPRGHEKALWERFRKACDRFFTRRDEDLDKRKEEWARNLESKEALLARAEALAVSTDWKAAADAIKRLQAEWKTLGPVRRSQSEALWRRFHAACDRFFERYKRRDQIDLEASVAAREAILTELQGLGAAPPAEAAEALLETLRALRKRWQQAPTLPRERAAALGERFNAALGRLLAARADDVKDTDFDAQANLGKMEDLCARLERLLPGGPAADESLSPATRLATMWRERMAANTIGGKGSDEARRRAQAEEVRKARASWERIGYVSEEARRALAARFEEACRRLAPKTERAS
ncbi:MAG: hypothetical protein DMF50_05000 [Acidobacteria bacterium]|nr:MAG: hypothetical protein DMF50_05000 [Acidobacteriota bacterium]